MSNCLIRKPSYLAVSLLSAVLMTMVTPATPASVQSTFCFTAPTPGAVTGFQNNQWVALADLNRDGYLDVVKGQSNGVAIRLGNDAGRFAAPTPSSVPAGNSTSKVAVADFNGDGNPDLAVPDILDGVVRVFLGDGHGHFAAASPPSVSVGDAAWEVAVGDFNGDGNADLAVSLGSSSDLVIRVGNGLGGFTDPGWPAVSVGAAAAVTAADVNGDGVSDLLAAGSLANSVAVRLGARTGGFTSPTVPYVPIGRLAHRLAVADFNRDGHLDFAVVHSAANGVSIRLGDGQGGFTSPSTPLIALSGNTNDVAAGDFDLDGLPDLAVITRADDTVTLLHGNGDGTFQVSQTVSVGHDPNAIAAGDIDKNGTLDLVVADNATGSVSIRLSCHPNQPPIVTVPGSQVVAPNGSLTLSSAAGSAVRIADADAGTLPVRVSLSVAHGSITLSRTAGLTFSTGDGIADATMTFTGTVSQINAALDGLVFDAPNGTVSSEQISVEVSDQGASGVGGPRTARGAVAVAIARPPTAGSDRYGTVLGTVLTVPAPGILGNDTDTDSATLKAVKVTDPTHGTLSLAANGGFTYTPEAGYTGADVFAYRASDGVTLSEATTVLITIAAPTLTPASTPITTPCGPRPKVQTTPIASGGKLNVRLESLPLPTQQNNPMKSITFGPLQNAKVTLNGQSIVSGQPISLSANTIVVEFTVERVTPAQSTTVPITVVDGCGEWKTFVGGGIGAAGF